MFDKEFRKLDKKINDSFKVDLIPEPKRKFLKPKPRYTKKNKPIMTKKDQETAKKIIKETGSAFGSLIKKIKNRKINKLEKEYFKATEKRDNLAHEIKLRTGLNDSKEDIERYEKELEKLNAPKDVNHSQACKDFNLAKFEDEEIKDCICRNPEK